MIFTDLNGQLTLLFHQPNNRTKERACFYPIEDTGISLRIEK